MDSVLKKAEELENSLRLWRERLGVVSTPTEADTAEEDAPHTLSGMVQPVESMRLPIPALCSSVTGAIKEKSKGQERMEGAWQQVTTYIVQLEKRLREMELHTPQGNEACTNPSQEKCPRSRPVSATYCGAPHNEEIEKEIRESQRLVQTDSHTLVLLLVFKWLNTAELCRVSQVCHRWRGVARHPDLWRILSLRETVVTSKDLCNLGQWCRHTEVISLHGLMPEMAGLEEELHSYIARQRGSLEHGLAQLLSAAPHLTSLSVTECNLMITERLLWLCSVHSPQLRQFTYTSDEFPPSPAALWALSNGCTQLQSLHLPPYLGSPFSGYFNDFCLSSIAKGWPHLLYLTVGGAGITAAGLSEIVQYCPWLEELCVIHGPKLSSTDVRDMTAGGGLTALHSLSLSFTPISPKAFYQLCIACPKLSSVTLHISPNTYFPGQVSADMTILEKYHQIQLNFQELQKMPQLKDILHLQHHPLHTDTVI